MWGEVERGGRDGAGWEWLIEVGCGEVSRGGRGGMGVVSGLGGLEVVGRNDHLY